MTGFTEESPSVASLQSHGHCVKQAVTMVTVYNKDATAAASTCQNMTFIQ